MCQKWVLNFLLLTVLIIDSISILYGASMANNSDYKELNGPNKLSNCKAQLDDQSIIDLSSLNNKNNPR